MGTKSLPGQRHPGGVPWVNSALWCGGSPVRNPGGTPIFWPLPFRGDRLETKKGARELGLIICFHSSCLAHVNHLEKIHLKMSTSAVFTTNLRLYHQIHCMQNVSSFKFQFVNSRMHFLHVNTLHTECVSISIPVQFIYACAFQLLSTIIFQTQGMINRGDTWYERATHAC